MTDLVQSPAISSAWTSCPSRLLFLLSPITLRKLRCIAVQMPPLCKETTSTRTFGSLPPPCHEPPPFQGAGPPSFVKTPPDIIDCLPVLKWAENFRLTIETILVFVDFRVFRDCSQFWVSP